MPNAQFEAGRRNTTPTTYTERIKMGVPGQVGGPGLSKRCRMTHILRTSGAPAKTGHSTDPRLATSPYLVDTL